MTTPVLPTHRSRRRNTKGNDGRAAERNLARQAVVVIAGLCIAFIIFTESLKLAGTSEVDSSSGGRVNIESIKPRKKRAIDPNTPLTDEDRVDLILSGEAHLVDVKFSRHGITKAIYEGAIGHFCVLDWSIHKKDPSSSPMFRDLVNKSGCKEDYNTFTYDLRKIVKLAIASDSEDVKSMEPAGFVFHESRCGSTLVANILAAMDPAQNRVYSESAPPMAALRACGFGGTNCPPHRAAELVQDVVYMMGRTNDPTENNLFFKVQSIGTKYLDVLTEAFPETPFIFVYRDPVHVMMSQLAHGTKNANCVRQLAQVPKSKKEFLESMDRSLNDLSPEEQCALHLSLLCEKAVGELSKPNSMGTAVNYENLVDTMIETILPEKFNMKMTDQRRDRIVAISGHYSKGRGKKKREWKEDSEKKETMASAEVREASETFLYPSYNKLQAL